MHLCILYNRDADVLETDPGREAREDVTRVASALRDALCDGGTRVSLSAIGADPIAGLEQVRALGPDLVLNLCESVAADSRGEMAIPCLLDVLGIPYTGSGGLSLGLALHKEMAKELLRGRGVKTPEARLLTRVEDVVTVDLPFPLIVKPTREDASVGIDFDSVVHEREGLGQAVARVLGTLHQPALVEQYIEGREVYVPLLGNTPRRALPLSEIAFGKAFDGRPRIVSYRAKWDAGSAEYQQSPSGPCSLPPQLEERVVAAAIAGFEALGCRDYGRVDLRLAADGQPYVIDINPNCDLHPDAGYARAARAAGIDYAALARRLVEIALERTHGNPAHRPTGQGTARRPARPNRNVLAARGGLRGRAHRSRTPAE